MAKPIEPKRAAPGPTNGKGQDAARGCRTQPVLRGVTGGMTRWQGSDRAGASRALARGDGLHVVDLAVANKPLHRI